MNYLSGFVEHSLDSKNRTRIPAKYKALFPKGEALSFQIYRDECISIYPDSMLQEHLGKAFGKKSSENRNKARYFSAGIFPLTEDTQGRVSIPLEVRQKLGMKKDLVTLGMFDHIEIWSKERFAERVESIPADEVFDEFDF